MGEKTGISWCDHTFNPWWGCVKVSPGCAHCYAETWAKRMGQDGLWGVDAGRRFFDDRHWAEPLAWNRKAERDGVKRRVFCGSMCDIFEDWSVGLDCHRERVWQLIEQTPNLIWLLLTKRPENIERMLPERWSAYSHWEKTGQVGVGTPRNIWLGTTVENQDMLEQRWPVLESVGRSFGFRVLWVSMEPLLSQIDMSNHIDEFIEHEEDNTTWIRGIDWVVAGGESGPKARPMHPDWVRSLRDQCQAAGVPFFFKQWGEWEPFGGPIIVGTYSGAGIFLRRDGAFGNQGDYWKSEAVGMDKVGKKAAGRSLDGRMWNEFPGVE